MYVMAILNMLTCYDQYAAAARPGSPTRYNLNTGITEVHVVFPDACTHAASCPLFIHDEPCLFFGVHTSGPYVFSKTERGDLITTHIGVVPKPNLPFNGIDLLGLLGSRSLKYLFFFDRANLRLYSKLPSTLTKADSGNIWHHIL